jgi:hypothetical protein
MVPLLGGLAGFLASGWVFWLCLPDGNRARPFLTPAMEPYVAVAITLGAVMSAGFIILGALNLVAA